MNWPPLHPDHWKPTRQAIQALDTEQRYAFEERAAIRHFCGEEDLRRAEVLALREVVGGSASGGL